MILIDKTEEKSQLLTDSKFIVTHSETSDFQIHC